MTYECTCDYDPPTFYRSRIVRKARRKHKCCECAGDILPGESYEDVTGLWEGYFDRFKSCERCYDLRIWVKNNVPCFCPMHGDMDQQMDEAIDDAYWRAKDEVTGLRFGYLRRRILRDQHNKSGYTYARNPHR